MFSEEIDVTQDLRILQLLPRDQVVTPLPIDPAIPEDFIALDLNGKQDVCLGMWWGPKDIIRTALKERSEKWPLIFVKLSSSISQKEYGKLDIEAIKRECSILEEMTCQSGNWGALPYALVEGSFGDKKMNCLFVGNNQNGIVYFFSLMHPEDKKLEPSAMALWDRFVKETKQLPEPLFFKCLGQEMHIGHTISDSAGRKLLFKAEYNEEKNLVLISVEPHEGTIDFQYSAAELCKMGANWHQNEDMVKINGMISVENGWINSNQTTSVLLKKTKTFSKRSKDADYHQVFKINEEGKLIPLKTQST